MLDVVTAGEAMVLFAAESPGPLERVATFARHSAGAELNVAIGLARLGLRVGYVSRLGNDSFGRYLASVLDREDIDRSRVEIDPTQSTGFMLKSRGDDGRDPAIEYHRRGSAASLLRPEPGLAAYCASARHLHLTGISPALSEGMRHFTFGVATQARERGQRLSFDPNIRLALWPDRRDMVETLNALAALSDLVLPGVEEGRLLTGCAHPRDIAEFYLRGGARQVVVKLGPRGALCADSDGRFVAVPGLSVDKVVDTVGAGDGFAVGVISALLEGHSLETAAHRGNAIGARVIQFPGDCDGLPTREQLSRR
jgi:2-dehydro-3-deoxygluconokinase